MGIKQSDFKLKLYDAVMDLVKKTWYKLGGVYILFMLAFYLIMIIILVAALGLSGNGLSLDSFSNINNLAPMMTNLFQDAGAAFWIGYGVFIIIGIIAGSWMNNLMFLIIDDHIKSDSFEFNKVFKKSFDKRVFKVIGAMLLMYLIFGILGVLMAFSVNVSGWLTFVLAIVFILVAFRLIIVIPAVILGDLPVFESISFSVKHITFGRSLKLFLLAVLSYVVMLVMLLVIGLISTVFVMIPYIGPVFQIVLQFSIIGIFASLFISSMAGIYYRYAPIIDDESLNIEDHLVSDL